jgi:predicted enzyme related to lactoylglutathione lyase
VHDLAALVAKLRSNGHEIVPAEGVPGYTRVHVADPFGNRIELMEARPD